MKKSNIVILLTTITLCMAFQCEDEPFATKEINVPDLIKIETKNNYVVNDSIHIDATFSRYLPESGFTNLLDIYKTSNSPKFSFSLSLEKKNSDDTWAIINPTIVKVNKGEYILMASYATTILNLVNNNYESRVGFKLNEIGEYRIGVSKNLFQTENTQKIRLNISSSNDKLDQNGYYIFTVN